jgi:aldehyde dehydrogenase (NAD+)
MAEAGMATGGIERAPAIVERLRQTFASGRTRDLAWRRSQLEALRNLCLEGEPQLVAALQADFSKPPFDTKIAETRTVAWEIDHALPRLARWMRGRRAGVPWALWPGSARIVPEPLGVALVIAPWNYPVQLLLSPLVGALAAGNCAVLKPSELTSHTSDALASLVPRYLDNDAIVVVTGDAAASTALLAERFDHIFFTGGARVGRVVMEAAAKHLTPVTLELGGKSPCIVAADGDLKIAAERIVWGKFLNAGQTCVAPDYVLVARTRHDALIDALRATIARFFGSDPKTSPDLARIVSETHVERLAGYLDGGRIVVGGEVDRAARYVAPTVLADVRADAPVMREEIFGPILPVIAVADADEAIGFVNAREKPLALYLFTGDANVRDKVIGATSSGGVCINDVVVHLSVPGLPFGGVGASGFGRYHGRAGFETFSNMKGVLSRNLWPEPPLRTPPHSETKLRWIDRLM